MKKIMIMLCSLLMLMSLVGCAGNKTPELKEYTHGDIVLQLPSDVKETTSDGDFEYTLNNDNLIVYVSSITKEELKGYGWEDLDLEGFTEQVIGGDEVILRKTLSNCEVFSYVAKVEEDEYYYMIANYENNDKFYIVNFVCFSKDREKMESSFLDYAGKVTFK